MYLVVRYVVYAEIDIEESNELSVPHITTKSNKMAMIILFMNGTINFNILVSLYNLTTAVIKTLIMIALFIILINVQ